MFMFCSEFFYLCMRSGHIGFCTTAKLSYKNFETDIKIFEYSPNTMTKYLKVIEPFYLI